MKEAKKDQFAFLDDNSMDQLAKTQKVIDAFDRQIKSLESEISEHEASFNRKKELLELIQKTKSIFIENINRHKQS